VGFARIVSALALAISLSAAPARAGCVGDCDGNGRITVDEVITLVNIALGNGGACPDGVSVGTTVDIAVIIQAVNNALDGCTSSTLALWVTSGGVGPGNVNQVTAYPLPIGSNPDITPAVTIVGQFNSQCTAAGMPFPCCTGSMAGTCVDNTGLAIPSAVALDSSGNIYVGNASSTNSSITVYAPGSNGNATPIRTIAGSNTMLLIPRGLALAGGNIYTANVGNTMSEGGAGAVLVFPATGNGNIPPTACIFTPKKFGAIATDIVTPYGIVLDLGAANIYVADPSGPWILDFGTIGVAGNCPLDVMPNSMIACLTGIQGGTCDPSTSQLGYPYGITMDPNGNIYVTSDEDREGNNVPSILIYAPGSANNATPLETIQGQFNHDCTAAGVPYACCTGDLTGTCVDNTQLNTPQGITLDSSGNIYVANLNFTITVYPPFTSSTFVGTVNQAPIATINTGFVGNSPTGLAVGPFTP
jgi:hypothetical protein